MDGVGRVVDPRLPDENRVGGDVEHGQILTGDDRAIVVRADLVEHTVDTRTDIQVPQRFLIAGHRPQQAWLSNSTGRGLKFPNGIVITPDGRTLIIAETERTA